MRGWAIAWIGVSAPLALLLLQCGGGSGATGDDDLRLPERTDPSDGRAADAPPALPDSAVDAGASKPACDPERPFGAPVRMAEFDPGSARSTPRLSPDELTIYFTSRGADAGADLSMAVRPSKSAPFADEKVLPQSTASNENDPSVGADHLSLWFHSTRNGSADIFLATRPSTGVAFGAAALIPTVDQPTTNENHAYFRGAGDELWFISDRPGGLGSYDIYVTKRTGETFAAPAPVAEINSADQDWQPQPSEDGLTVLLASDRAGGLGKMDLWIARRSSIIAPFGTPTAITELNSPNVDQAGWLSADGCRIWFSSGRDTNDATAQLFFAQRSGG